MALTYIYDGGSQLSHSYLRSGEVFDRLLAAKLIVRGGDRQLERIRAQERIYYPRGGTMGRGTYAADQIVKQGPGGANGVFYVLGEGITFTDIDKACARIEERRRREHEADILGRIDATYEREA